MQLNFSSDDLRPLVAAVVLELSEKLIPDDRLGVEEKEAARLIGVQWNVLRDCRRRGEIAAAKVGKRRIYLRRDLVAFLEERKCTE